MSEPERVDTLLAALTLDEKAALTAGADLWTTVPVDRVGIPAWILSDGPAGVRGRNFERPTPSACMPCATALGATWNPALLEQVGAVIGDQSRTKEVRVLLAPTVNLHRSPLGGRTFESYGEDPLHVGLLAAAFVRGVQSRGVAATVKHFAGNEAEFDRHVSDSVIDERTLREIYLVPFELAVREGGALAIMTGYNRLNGTWCAEHPELFQILRDEWGFEGLVMTDWFAVDSTIGSALAGLDLEMPGPGRQYGPALADAVRAGKLDESVLDGIVRRILAVFARLGALDDAPPSEPEGVDNRPEHRAVARQAAVEATVLLRNEGVLPFDVDQIKTLAVIGPNADRAQILGGGSASLEPHYRVTPLEALRRRLGDRVAITYEQGCDIDLNVPPLLLPLKEVFEADGAELERGEATSTRLLYSSTRFAGVADKWSVRATGTFVPEADGPHEVVLVQAGRARVLLDGVAVVDGAADPPPPGDAFFGMGSQPISGTVDLRAGVPLELVIELSNESAPFFVGALVGVRRVVPAAELLDRAIAAAQAADAVVVVVGTNDDWETEGHDRATLRLPGDQDELVQRVCAANANTAVVLNAGSPLELPWADEAPALLDVWFGGQEMADALVDVLVGDADPSGRLPSTFPMLVEHTPAFGNFPGAHGEVRYGEGLLVGYRWYDSRTFPVRFPFGHGLSYTTFAVAPPEVTSDGDHTVVRVAVTNTGTRAGAEVVQLYVEPVDSPVFRPRKELKSFAKVFLEPGRSATVTLVLTERAFAYWQPQWSGDAEVRARAQASSVVSGSKSTEEPAAGWRAHPGSYRLHVGRSAADIAHVVAVERP